MPDQKPTSIWDADPPPPAPAPAPGAPIAPRSIWDSGPDPLETSLNAARPQQPDTAARVLQLQMKTGLPPAVIERNIDEVERKAAASDFNAAAFRASYPGLATWLQEPANAKIAHDDLEKLGLVSQILERPKNLVRSFASGVNTGVAGAFGALEFLAKTQQPEIAPFVMNDATQEAQRETATAFFQNMRQSVQKNAELAAADKSSAGMLERGIYSGVESIGMMAPAMIASMMTGEPGPMLAIMGIETGGGSYGTAIDKGYSHGTAARYGAIDAAIEVATEYLPAKWFLDDLAKNAPLRQIVMHELQSEIPGELIATTFQNLNEWATLNPDKSFKSFQENYLEQLPGALAETVIATLTSVAFMGAVGKVATQLAGDGGRAKQAELDKDFFSELAKGVKGSETVKRMPAKAQELFAQLTEGGPVENVYIPADVFATYFQDKEIDTPQGKVAGAEAIASALTGRADALKDAQRTGEPLEVKTAVYAAQLAGTEHHDGLVEDLRLGSPHRMNARESAAYRKAQAELEANPPLEQEQPAPENPIRQIVLQKLQAGLTASGVKLPRRALERYADLFNALVPTLAARENLDPVDVLRRYGLIVEGPTATDRPPAAPRPRTRLEELEEENRNLRRQVEVDSLTGVANRTALDRALPTAETDPETSVIAFDANNFGKVNKIAGHDAGDAMLKQMAAAIKAAATEAGVGERVFRRGGDEFVVLAPAKLAKQIHTRAAEIFGSQELTDETGQTVQVSLTGTAGNTFADADRILQAAKRVTKAGLVDRKVDPAQTTEEPTDAASEPLPNRLADKEGRSARHRIAPSDPGNNTDQAQRHLDRVFNALLESARKLDAAVNPAELRAEFDYRLELYLEAYRLKAEDDNKTHDLLRAIAKLGGIAETDQTSGELRELRGKFGTVAGVPGIRGVFRTKVIGTTENKKTAGHDLDVMLEMLHSSYPEFQWIESIDMLVDQLDELSRRAAATMSMTELPGTEELRDVNIREELAWWEDPWRNTELPEPDENPDDKTPDASAGDTDFTFNQDPVPTARYAGEQEDGLGGTMSLYTVIGGPSNGSTVTAERLTALGIAIPPVDTLDTGELQPRLFGDESAPPAAPLADPGFTLVSEVQRTNQKTRQRTLFQDPIEADQVVAPAFYSRIVRTVELSTLAKASGAQWQGTIKNSKLGVNLDEFAMTSVNDLDPNQVYTKQEVLDYLSVHRVRISEVILGEPMSPAVEAQREQEVQALAESLYQRHVDRLVDDAELLWPAVDVKIYESEDEPGRWTFSLDGDEDGYTYDDEDEARDEAIAQGETENERREQAARGEYRQAVQDNLEFYEFEVEARRDLGYDQEEDDGDNGTQYSDSRYQVGPTPGFDRDTYREAFVTAEGVQYTKGNGAIKARLNRAMEREDAARQRVRALRGAVFHTAEIVSNTAPLDVPANRESFLAAVAEREAAVAEVVELEKLVETTSWEDGHEDYSNIVNPIVRLRFNTRYANELEGPRQKILFLEEIQPPSEKEQQSMPPLYLKNWREIGLKWALRYAAEHGYDGLAWTTGEQQRERYSLKREVRKIDWRLAKKDEAIGWGSLDTSTTPPGFKVVTIAAVEGGDIQVDVNTDTGKIVSNTGRALNWSGKHLSDVIGKELTDKILADETGVIQGDGLDVGGIGLKKLYDVDLVNVVNKLPAVKGNGGRVTAFNIGVTPDRYVVRETQEGGSANWRTAWIVDHRVGNQVISVMRHEDQAKAEEHAAALNANVKPVLQPGLAISPALKQAVLGGQTLFQDPKPELIIQHNLTARKLQHAAKLGGLPVPSLAIAKADDALVNFGEITLIGHKEMADPRGYAKPKVFGADVYSPRYPTIHYKIDRAGEARLSRILAPYSELAGQKYFDLDELQKKGVDELRTDARVMAAYLESIGKLDRDAVAAARQNPYKPAGSQITDTYYADQAARNEIRRQLEDGNEGGLEAYAREIFDSLGAKEQIFRGFTNQGNRSYKPHTLENVVAILKKNIRGGESESNIYGVGQLRSKFTQQFKSVKQIVEAKDRIVSDAAFDAVKEETEKELFAIADELAPYYEHDAGRFGFVDTVMAVMEDGARKGLPFALKDYGFTDVPDETRQRIAGFMVKLRTMPTEYFEAKILREVDLAEFAGAVVPANTDPDIIQMLERRGLEVSTYDTSERRKLAIQDLAKKLGDKVMFQDPPDPPAIPQKRGSITGAFDRNAFFGPELQFTIKLFESADTSTFLHESAHLFLKIMQDLEARPEASEGIKRDLAIIRERFGPDGVDQHELFARSFEAYLLEGRAPSLELRSMFDEFRAWLLRLYKTMLGLNVQLTDDVRGVFDRMLASDQAIAEAQAAVAATPMFLTAEEARMSPSEFDIYRQKIAAASRKSRKELEQKLLKDLQRQQTQAYRAEKAEIRKHVTDEVHRMPVYQALAAMRKGTQPNGDPLVEGQEVTPLKLSKQAIIEKYGVEKFNALPAPAIYTADENGLDPDAVAQMFGFSSGDEMLTTIANAPTMRGMIEAETKKRAQQQLGDLVLDNQLSDLARAAVANEHREEIVRIELETLSRLRRTAQAGAVKEREYERRWFEAEAKLRIAIAEGRVQARADREMKELSEAERARRTELRAKKNAEIERLTAEVKELKRLARSGPAMVNAAIPTEADLKQIALERIGRTRVRDLKPETFYTAAREAGQRAFDAAARQDFTAAIAAKQQEQIALAIYREASRAKADLEERVKYAQALDRPGSRRRIGLAGGGYQEQIDAILDRYDFARITGKALDKRQALRTWITQLEAEGFAVDLPDDLVDDARRTHYRELTVDELTNITDGLKSIVKLAQLKLRLLKNREHREFAIVRNGLVESIRGNSPLAEVPLEFRKKDDLHRRIKEWFASHARIATLGQVMDGNKEGGAFWSAIIRPINEAASAKERRNAEEGKAYAAILEKHYPGRELGKMGELLYIPEIGGSLSKEARLSVAMNWGNETSRDRLLNDPKRKWNERQIKAILDTLDANDLAFVQATFDFLERFWPEIAAKTERLTGVPPEKVLPAKITTKAGTIPGGYYPLVYDSRLNLKGQQQEEAQAAKLKISAAYVQSTTRRGHLITRKQNVKRSAKLELGVVFSHLEQVIHDLTHHEMLIDVTRLLRDPQVQDAILETKGDLVYQQFTRALESIAAGQLEPAKNGVEKAATWMRTGSQVAGLGFNLWTGIQQPLGLFNGAERVGVRWVARGLKRWLVDAATMQRTTEWIHDVSPFMASRSVNATQDLSDLRNTFREQGGWFDTLIRTVTRDVVTQQHIIDSFLWHIGLMQRVADVPTWLGQYEKSMAAGETEERAIALADQAVIDSQGSGRISDLSQVQRGGPIARLFLTFYSYGATTYNATYRTAGQTNFKSPASVTRFLGHLSMIYIMPAMASVALARALGKTGDDDDDWTDFIVDVGQESLAAAMNTMMWLREGSQLAADGVRGYSGPAGARALVALYKLGGEMKQGVADAALTRAALSAAGVIFRFPAAQAQRTIDGWVALEEGRTENPLALLFGPPR